MNGSVSLDPEALRADVRVFGLAFGVFLSGVTN